MTKVYTKTGDKGTTSLVGGERISKDDARLEAYGTVDELNSWLGAVLCGDELCEADRELLCTVQCRLFDIGSYLATEPGSKYAQATANPVRTEEVEEMEHAIDRLDAGLPALHSFVMPRGCRSACDAHVARTVCRRAERSIIALSGTSVVDSTVVAYINRLSDYLFLLSRALNRASGITSEPMWATR